MFEEYSQICPNERQPIGDVLVFHETQNAYKHSYEKNQRGPNGGGDAESAPTDAYQIDRNIGDGRYGNPSEIRSERHRNQPLFFSLQTCRGYRIGYSDERYEHNSHDEHGEADEIVVPSEYPSGVGDRRYDERDVYLSQ